jgi:hypothetical protein
MQFFGADIEAANRGDERYQRHGPKNLLDLLPDEFTLEDAMRARAKQGLPAEKRKCSRMISQWVFRKYVLQITDYSYKKSDNYKNKTNNK